MSIILLKEFIIREKAKCAKLQRKIYVDIAKGVKTRFDTSNFELEKPLPTGKIRNIIELIK